MCEIKKIEGEAKKDIPGRGNSIYKGTNVNMLKADSQGRVI